MIVTLANLLLRVCICLPTVCYDVLCMHASVLLDPFFAVRVSASATARVEATLQRAEVVEATRLLSGWLRDKWYMYIAILHTSLSSLFPTTMYMQCAWIVGIPGGFLKFSFPMQYV